uniref:Conotoxin Lt12.9 n=1 Tax=Conus litteratus TaxID=89445 RepID=C8BLR9_CONLT|nr:conotoxin Lt12.9 [Conus litteratus]
MFGHTSVSFLLLSIMVLGVVATVICSCGVRISSEICEQPEERICSCSNHMCCPLNPSQRDQCMARNVCFIMIGIYGGRRSTRMQERFLRMSRGLADYSV